MNYQQIESRFQELKEQDGTYQDLLGLGEKALHEAQVNSVDKSITWYSLAIRIYNELESRQKSFSVSSGDIARLRLISLLGIMTEKCAPHIEYLLGVINVNLPANKDVVHIQAADWSSLPIDEIRNLRRLKMRLKLAQELSKEGLTLSPEIFNLLDLIAILP